MSCVLPLKCIDFFPLPLLLNCPLSKGLVYIGISGDGFLRKSAAFSLPFCPKHLVCDRKFRTTSFQIRATGKTNDREEIFLHTL